MKLNAYAHEPGISYRTAWRWFKSRVGFNDIAQLLAMQDRKLEVIDLAENGKEDLIQDLVSIVTSSCAPLYGQQCCKRKTERIMVELQNGEEGDHPSQTRPG
jgi:predicted site-specific integrase-resolvase